MSADGCGGETQITDARHLEHLAKSPWMTPDSCTCRERSDGMPYQTCRRKACNGEGQVCGSYCPSCFKRRMSKPHRPEIVVLCGSTRFKSTWRDYEKRFTHEGLIVLSVGDLGTYEGVNEPIDPALKERLDELHKRKIDMADRVFVLNVDGYIGASTRSEIEYAEWFEKPIEYLIPAEQGC